MIGYPLRAAALGIDYVFDPGQALPMLAAEDLVEVIKNAGLLIVNDYEFNLIQDKTGLSESQLLALAQTTIVTLGGEGSRIHGRDGVIAIPAFHARRVVDPTGAGDAYRGGLLSGLVNGFDLPAAARRASACASFAVECNGTQVYTFTAEELLQRMQQ
jgi:adenosine kinase